MLTKDLEMQLRIDVAEFILGWIRQTRYDNEIDMAAIKRGRIAYRQVGHKVFLIPKDQEYVEEVGVRAEVDGLCIGGDLPTLAEVFPLVLRRMLRWGYRLDVWFDDERAVHVARFMKAGRPALSVWDNELETVVALAAVAGLRP